jgi:ribosomal-protein-alanine acetyltransferase
MVKTDAMDITCAILAGGGSTRMGRDKATLTLGDRPLIHHVYEKARKVFKEVIILSKARPGFEGIDAAVLPDLFPIQSPMVGVVSALLYANTPYVFILACDMPALSEKALAYMVDQVRGEDVIIPRTSKGYEALHAIYGRSCISYFLTAIGRGRLRINDVLAYLRVREVWDHPVFVHKGRSVFTNINVKEDLVAASGRDCGAGIEIRQMRKEDLKDVLAVERKSFVSPWTRGLFEEALLSPIALNYIVRAGDRLAGYLCLYTVLDEAHILNIAVSPGERKKGYASALMGRVIDELKEEGVTQFHLEVRESNRDAILLYGKFGFVAIDKRKKYYTDTNEDAILMYLAAGNG